MSKEQMIARAWLDESFRTSLIAQGIDVPSRADDLSDDELGIPGEDREYPFPGAPCT
jgi:hypothetical protein